MNVNDWSLGIAIFLLPVVFISIFKYRIAGSNPNAVLVGGVILSIGVVFVVYQLVNRVFSRRYDVDVFSIAVGTLLISGVVAGTYFGLSPSEYGDWAPLLTIVGAVVVVTFWVGGKTAGDLIEGMLHGFLTAGASSVLSILLISYEAITREVVFNALVAITSVGIPLVLGTIGAVFGLLGSSFARRRSGIRIAWR